MIVELTNAHLLIPMVKSHIGHIPKPKEGLTVAIPAENGTTNGEMHLTFPAAIEHLPQLDKDASTPLELSKSALPDPGTTVEFQQEPLQEDSDVDLETGKVRIPTSSLPEAVKMTYKARLVLEDHQEFASAVLQRERKYLGSSPSGE